MNCFTRAAFAAVLLLVLALPVVTADPARAVGPGAEPVTAVQPAAYAVLSLQPIAGPGTPYPADEVWLAPVDPFVLVRDFATGPQPWSPGHRGIDLLAEPGTPVTSPTAGRVAFAGTVAGTPVVVIAHADGLRSTFEPATAAVPFGTGVRRGSLVATVAPGGHCPAAAPCVHWGVLRGSTYLDPMTFLGLRGPVILLPLGAVHPAAMPWPPSAGPPSAGPPSAGPPATAVVRANRYL